MVTEEGCWAAVTAGGRDAVESLGGATLWLAARLEPPTWS